MRFEFVLTIIANRKRHEFLFTKHQDAVNAVEAHQEFQMTLERAKKRQVVSERSRKSFQRNAKRSQRYLDLVRKRKAARLKSRRDSKHD